MCIYHTGHDKKNLRSLESNTYKACIAFKETWLVYSRNNV